MDSNINRENANKCGICKITNNIDNRIYIGSAVQFRKRRDLHVLKLKQNKHHSTHLQNFVNKYGMNILFFDIIEECDNFEILIEREQYYINMLKPEFNICKIAGSQIGIKRSDEFKRKISERQKGKKLSELTKLKKSIAMKEFAKNNPEYYSRLKEINKKIKRKPHTDEAKLKMKLNNTKRLSDDVIEQIKELGEKNYTFSKIAKELNISWSSAKRYSKNIKNEL